MKTITLELFSYEDLTDKAQTRAYHDWQKEDRYFWGAENSKSFDEFMKAFELRITGRSEELISENGNSVDEIGGFRLAKYIWNNYESVLFKRAYRKHLDGAHPHRNTEVREKYTACYSSWKVETGCVLTGYCMDDSILAPIYEFLKKPDESVTFEYLMNSCKSAYVEAYTADVEYGNSVELFKEECESNDWTFEADGSMRNE